MTLQEFNKGFNILLAYYPNTKNIEELSQAYFLGLAELTYAEFKTAIGRIFKEYESDFLPKIPVILKYARNDLALESQLFFAKKMLKASISRHGRTGMINFEDKGIHAVIDYVGWIRLLNMTDTEFNNFLNFQFDKIYTDFMKNPYNTNEYYTGTSILFGQTEPKLITYESIGVNSNELKFIPLEYKKNTQIEFKKDISRLKNKMLLGG